jgi:hypothetical protein
MKYPPLAVKYSFFYSLPCAVILASNLLSLAVAQTVQSILWNTPNGNEPDLSQTFTNGQTLPVSWNAWTDDSYIDAYTNLVDLWVTSFDYNINQYSDKIKSKCQHPQFHIDPNNIQALST